MSREISHDAGKDTGVGACKESPVRGTRDTPTLPGYGEGVHYGT